jgi:hypothetical protein
MADAFGRSISMSLNSIYQIEQLISRSLHTHIFSSSAFSTVVGGRCPNGSASITFLVLHLLPTSRDMETHTTGALLHLVT